jgi:hypothetical protein
MDQAYIRNIDATKINAGTINVALTLNAATINSGYITGGTINAGTMNVYGTMAMGTGGTVASGQSAFDTGTGFWLGNTAGTPKFSIGNSAGNKLTWDGTNMRMTGTLNGASFEANSMFKKQLDGSLEGGQLALEMPTGVAGDWSIDAYSPGNPCLRFFVSNNPTYAAIATAEFDADINAKSYNTLSSIRFKTNVTQLKNSLANVEAMRGVNFDWIDGRKKQKDVGFIAEEVDLVIPEVVMRNPLGEVTGLDYGRITSILVEAVKELSAEVKLLKSKLNG